MRRTVFLCLLLFFSMPGLFSQYSDMQRIVDSVGVKYAPDKRVVVYRVKVTDENPRALRGVISDQGAYESLISSLRKASIPFLDSIRVLPDKKKLGEKFWAFVPLSVINISVSPSFDAEISKQALLGTPVKILDKRDGWYQIQTPDGYIGWTNTRLKSLSTQEKTAYNKKGKLIIVAHNAWVYEGKSDTAAVVSDVVMGNLLTLEENYDRENFVKVSLPDGRKGYVLGKVALPLNQWKNTIRLNGDNLIKLAKTFQGLPYFWGGTSVRGVDCSGFTNLIYFMHGVILPRDASQQYYCGLEVDTRRGWDKLDKGDLLFFGEKNEKNPSNPRVVHVAVYIGNSNFIHSSDRVHIASFDPQSALYDEYNHKRFLGAKRIISQPFINHWNLFEHPWYK